MGTTTTPAQPTTRPAGRASARGGLADRIRLTRDRLLTGGPPTMSDPFVLADVRLDPPRRFSNFSGDLSGRYIGALATADDGGPALRSRLASLVDAILAVQRPDGRFGRADLSFAVAAIDRQQMALLWGNGRLLVGLMEYHAAFPSTSVLRAAQRLGEFLAAVCDAAADDPAMQAKLDGAGAAGVICLTQCNEGLALLYRATGDRRWLDVADRTGRSLHPPGTQHSHGVLSTLRGQMLVDESDPNPRRLASVRDVYHEIVTTAGDSLVFGGVPEYFGGLSNPEVTAHSGGNPRDEGCSEADFVRLSLQLWHATGSADYLDRAERCLLNHLLSNQYPDGDFGHRRLSPRGFAPAESPARSWWCCTMHGLRAFADVLDAAVSRRADGAVATHLFLDLDWSDNDAAVRVDASAGSATTVEVRRAPAEGLRLAVRQPPWSGPLSVSVDGAPVVGQLVDGYVVLAAPLRAGSTAVVSFAPTLRLVDRAGRPAQAKGNGWVEAALFFGPWLMGVSAADDPPFFSEPFGNSVVDLPRPSAVRYEAGEPTLSARYQHEGFTEPLETNLRIAGGAHRNTEGAFAVWNRYRAAPGAT
jgi:DUF1680 family protein